METRCNLWRSAKAAMSCSAHDRAVIIHQLGKHADRRQTGEPAEIDARFGVTGAHEHAAVLGHQRKDVAGPHEVARAHIAVGERPHRVGSLFRRDAGGQAMAGVDRDREGGAERRVVARHHRIEMKPPRLFRGDRCANDAGRMADDERHLLRRAKRRGDEEIALVLAVVVVGDNDELAAREGGHGSPDALVGVAHRVAVAIPSA